MACRRRWRAAGAGRPAPSAVPDSRPWAAARRARPRSPARRPPPSARSAREVRALLDVDVAVDRVGVDAAGRDVGPIGDKRVGQRLLVAGGGRLVERAGAVPVGIESVVARRSDCLEERSRALAGPLELVGPGKSGLPRREPGAPRRRRSIPPASRARVYSRACRDLRRDESALRIAAACGCFATPNPWADRKASRSAVARALRSAVPPPARAPRVTQ